MKKNLFLAAFALGFSLAAQAQFTVWEDDFNDGDATDWTLLDVDGNGSNWAATGNLEVSEEGAPVFGTEYAVLSTYNISFEDGQNLPNLENNLAISPVIDLSLYSGAGQLIFSAETAIFDGNQNLEVYASTSPEQESFELLGTVTIVREPAGGTDVQFNNYTVDVSRFIGEANVYIAFKPALNPFIGYEIDNVSITAAGIAGVDAMVKTATILKQNPVADNLELQLGTAVRAEALNVKIYTVNGMLVKDAAYRESGIDVSDLSGGIYFMLLNDGAATEQLKFIKK